jgi:hypothetical protein
MVALGTTLYTPPHQEPPRVSDFPRRQLHTLFDPPYLLYPPFRNLRRLRSARPEEGVGDIPDRYRRGDLDHPVLLLVTVSVHRCLACSRYFRLQPPFLRRNAIYTDRVVSKAVYSVYQDGMAVRRVARRLARDFWVKPSEAMIRRLCSDYAEGLDFDGDYQKWVVEEFSGILCVDEVYQDKLALLLAVDPAAPGSATAWWAMS